MNQPSFTIECNNCGTKREIKTAVGFPPSEAAIFINGHGNITIRCTGCPDYITVGWRSTNG